MSSLRDGARLRVLHVTPECAPMTKTGGLGDVSEALPAALRAAGMDAMTLLPGYPPMLEHVGGASEAARLNLLGFDCRLLRADPFIVVDCPPLYARDGGPYHTPDGQDWEDNALRFGLLSRVAARLGGARSPLDWRPAIVDCHDWPAGLAPGDLADEARGAAPGPWPTEPRPPPWLPPIHNLAFQGNYDAQLLAGLEIPPSAFTLDG